MNKQQFESYCDSVLIPRLKKFIENEFASRINLQRLDELGPIRADLDMLAAEVARLGLLNIAPPPSADERPA